ncbi:uncharacterized protein LOC130623096 [Hydractinia symbiolongicarpus]|uniref:uncharacterized protein LOC130623096 n=1 Tax=Hydractinia symbiolongicarpus TaxID=13093 RepID=UPI00254BF080|nr:uncharacterized protein LOC130623096 [Hydractinia symbiolongicarpus]
MPQTPYRTYPLDRKKKLFIDEEIQSLLGKGVIRLSSRVNMTVALTPKKKAAIIDLCQAVTQREKITIRTLARLIGKFTSSLIGVPHGRLYYRSTERLKIESTRGWGASMTQTLTGGEFSSLEQEHHINVLELMAAFFGLQALCNHTANTTILLKMDNTSAVACVNKMGSVKSIPMDKITHSIWEWAISKNNWIVATHLPGILNVEADRESRQQETRTAWMLNKSTFRYALNELDFRPETDLFASRINTQLPAFFSYRPDPNCIGVNSFTEDWHNISFYAFPPFACLPQNGPITASTATKCLSSTAPKSKSSDSNCLREAINLKQSCSDDLKQLLTASWSEKTQSSYNLYLRKWLKFCKSEKIPEPYGASHKQGMDFLAFLFHVEKASYGYIAAARSALSAVLPKDAGTSFGKNEDVSRLIKGVFKLRPSLPKHTVIYDPDVILNYMTTLPGNQHLELEFLTKKLATLLCLLSGQRAQTIGALKVNFCHRSSDMYTFYISTIMKTTKPGKHQEPLQFEKYHLDNRICIVHCLDEYLRRTDLIRENLENQPRELLLSYAYPHKPIGITTIAKYVKTFLGLAGIDIKTFSTHSTRSASTSKAEDIGVPMKTIAKAAGWRGTSTFAKHYKLPISKNFGNELLKCL